MTTIDNTLILYVIVEPLGASTLTAIWMCTHTGPKKTKKNKTASTTFYLPSTWLLYPSVRPPLTTMATTLTGTTIHMCPIWPAHAAHREHPDALRIVRRDARACALDTIEVLLASTERVEGYCESLK